MEWSLFPPVHARARDRTTTTPTEVTGFPNDTPSDPAQRHPTQRDSHNRPRTTQEARSPHTPEPAQPGPAQPGPHTGLCTHAPVTAHPPRRPSLAHPRVSTLVPEGGAHPRRAGCALTVHSPCPTPRQGVHTPGEHSPSSPPPEVCTPLPPLGAGAGCPGERGGCAVTITGQASTGGLHLEGACGLGCAHPLKCRCLSVSVGAGLPGSPGCTTPTRWADARQATPTTPAPHGMGVVRPVGAGLRLGVARDPGRCVG